MIDRYFFNNLLRIYGFCGPRVDSRSVERIHRIVQSETRTIENLVCSAVEREFAVPGGRGIEGERGEPEEGRGAKGKKHWG